MAIVFGLLSTLLIPIAVIVGVVFLVRRGRDGEVDEVDDGIGSIRRAFIYGLALVSLMFAGSGVGMLLGGVFEAISGARVIADSDSQLAIALAFTVVGVPSWVIFAALAQRAVSQHPVESRSSLRGIYFGLARAVALVIVLVRGVDAIEAAFGAGEFEAAAFEGGAWGWALTWAAIWALHELIARVEPGAGDARTLDRLYRAFGAVVGLFMFGGGLVASLTLPALRVYDGLGGDTLVDRGGWSDATALATLALGGLTWWWHWFAGLRREPASDLWDVHVFLFGILTGVAVSVSAGGTVLFLLLQWVIGDPGASTAVAHFRGLFPALVFLAIGGASWAYHRLVLSEAREAHPTEPRSEPERVYRYLVAAAGLVALTAGLATVLALAIDVVTPSGTTFRDGGWWRDELTMAITLLAVGAPLWARYWFTAQLMVASGGAEEVAAPSRRIFVFGVFGIAILVAIVNLVIPLFEFFDAILGEGISAGLVRDTRWSVALLLTAGATSIYYWLVLREEPDAALAGRSAVQPRRALREVVLIGGAGTEGLRDALGASGVRVRVWRRADLDAAATPEVDLDAIRERLLASEYPRVAVMFGARGAEILPFELDG